MRELRVEFKFELGEAVLMRAGLEECKMRPDCVPIVFIINQRMAQQCPGGIQLHYGLGRTKETVLEHELAKLSEYDSATVAKARLDQELANENVKDKAREDYYEARAKARMDAKEAAKKVAENEE